MTAKVAAAVGLFDETGGWASDGATSMRAWLRDHGLSRSDAGFLVGAGRRVHDVPELGSAWSEGSLSGGQVRAVAAGVASRHVGLFAAHASDVVPALVGLDVDQTAAVAAWSARADALADGPVDDDSPGRELHLSKTFGGRFALDGTLDAEGGAVVAAALTLADSGDFTLRPAQRRADALVDVARFFLDHQEGRPSGRRRPHLNVVVDAAGLDAGGGGGELIEHGLPASAATVERLLCDCNLNRVVAEKVGGAVSAVLDYGRSVRTIPPPLWSALAVRDRHCRFPGCDRPPSWCEGHHVRWFRHGGTTSLDNLVLLCTRHHHLLHSRAGFEAKLLPDATFEVTLPSGVVRVTRPPPARRAKAPGSSPPGTSRPC